MAARALRSAACRAALVVVVLVSAFGQPPEAEATTVVCGGRAATIVGTPGRDRITGTAGPDVISGLGGSDLIRAGGGADVVCGGSGRDIIDGGSGDDLLFGGAGSDILRGGSGSDSCHGGPGRDWQEGCEQPAHGVCASQGPIDVRALVGGGFAWHSGSTSDIGTVENVFDGALGGGSLYRSAAVNPAFIGISFSAPVALRELRVNLSHASGDPAYEWWVEAADSEADLDTKSGSYALVVSPTTTASDLWSGATLAADHSATVVRLWVRRLTGDDYVHIDEWELYGDAPFALLAQPRGVAVDASGRTLVAEAGADCVTVFDQTGAVVGHVGSPGTAAGQLRRPWDLAIDPAGRVYVVDRGNNRVEVFTAGGAFLRTIGGSGATPGKFGDPQGVGVDGHGRIYIADTGYHRVQRFLPNGVLDPSWGGDGVVGASGEVRRDHSGFAEPTDVAIHPATGNVYVADRGNQRIEVFDGFGRYVRTHFAVYRANALAFDGAGNLFVAGEDPNEGYHPYDGRLRLLRAGDDLISGHYTGGLDDIGRIQGGVAVRPDGSVVFSDVLEGRLVAADRTFAPPLSDLRVDARGDSVTFRWKTRAPLTGSVRASVEGRPATLVVEGAPTTDHDVTVRDLAPGTLLSYGVSFPDTFSGMPRFTAADRVNTGVPAGLTQVLRLKAVGAIYTDVQDGPGYTAMSDANYEELRARFQRVADFFWRNSGCRLWLDIEVVTIGRDVVDSLSVWSTIEADLSALGRGPADDYDVAWAASDLAGGNFGGGGVLFGRTVGLAQWVTQTDFVAMHEVSHSIDSIYAASGLPGYAFNHGIWAVPSSGGSGHQTSVNGQILRNLLAASFTATTAPFTKILAVPDADGDSVPDVSVPGLLVPFSITEAVLGTSTSATDTDGDGLGDLAEVTALTYHGTDPLDVDTDGDGTRDGRDRNPAYPVSERIARGAPTVDGAISPAEGWTVMTDGWGYPNDAFSDDNNAHQGQVTTYAAWDDRYLYLAYRGPAARVTLAVDGDADNRFMGPANYQLALDSGAFSRSVMVNVGVPDLFRQIDDDGQWSELFDTDPVFTRPYNGVPFSGSTTDGAGFPGRLVDEGDLLYQRGGSGGATAWEVAIPWSTATSFRGFRGKVLGLAFDVAGDTLFETDRNAIVTLAG